MSAQPHAASAAAAAPARNGNPQKTRANRFSIAQVRSFTERVLRQELGIRRICEEFGISEADGTSLLRARIELERRARLSAEMRVEHLNAAAYRDLVAESAELEADIWEDMASRVSPRRNWRKPAALAATAAGCILLVLLHESTRQYLLEAFGGGAVIAWRARGLLLALRGGKLLKRGAALADVLPLGRRIARRVAA